MAFMLPTFAIDSSVWHAYDPAVSTYSAPDIDKLKGNLTPGKRVMQHYVNVFSNELGLFLYTFQMEYLTEKLADVRPAIYSPAALVDLIECPRASGRMYMVSYVDDIGKGFANEHRLVTMFRLAQDCVFTDTTISVPVPLT